jgi:predicted transposase/invertase (TIGR01784 family)
MELDEYKARMMFKADLKAQLEYAEETGMEKARLMYEADQREQLAYAEEKGIEIGEARGIEKGVDKGIKLKAEQTAIAMKSKGLHISLIAEITGLTVAEIENL